MSRPQISNSKPATAGATDTDPSPSGHSSQEPGAADHGEPSNDERPPGTLMLLVRHGATSTTGKVLPGRARGLRLSDTGRAEADAAAQRIAALHDGEKPNVAAVYASPLQRTRQTARPIAAAVGQDVHIDAGLLEIDTGEWTGLEFKAAQQRPEWHTIQRYPSGFRFPGGESFVEMQSRIVGTVDRLCAAHPGQMVIAVSHADPIRALVAHALGTHLDLFQRIVVSPGSLTAVAYGPGGPTVLTVNATENVRALVTS